MNDSKRMLYLRPAGVHLLAIFLAAVVAFSLLTDSATHAQTESAETLPAPTLNATSTDATTVELRWNEISGAGSYDLRVWWSGLTDWQRIDDGSLTGTSHRHEEMTPGRAYFYIVAAVDGNGNRGAWSERVSVTVPGAATVTPTSTPATDPAAATPTPTLTASPPAAALSAPSLQAQAAAGEVTLTWKAVTNAARYRLIVWDWAHSDWVDIGGALTGTSHTHRGLTAGTTYHFHIQAAAADGAVSAWSQRASATVPTAATQTATATPTPTLLLTATSTTTALATATPTPTPTGSALTAPVLTAEVGAGEITLSWSAAANAASYRLIVWDWATNDWQAVGGTLTGTSYTHRGLTVGTTYHYHIQAVAADGAGGGWSQRVSATMSEFATPTPTPTPATTERNALIALYEATGGDNWRRDDNWLTDAPLEAWFGVRTDSGDRVIGLRLIRNNLEGSIPDISALTHLWSLDLFENRLSGSIPDLSALTRLNYVNLHGNRLSGPIPDLSALTDLGNLSLYENQLSGPIPDLSALSKLTILVLSHNRLSGSIPDLGSLTSLEWLRLNENQLSGTIPDLSALTNLTILNLGHNLLSGPVPDLGALTNLEWLVLDHNRLTGTFPVVLGNLHDLTILHLADNELSGCIPTSLHDVRNNDLDRLGLPDCTPTTPTPPPPTPTSTPTPATTDKGALIALYQSTSGDNWKRKDNWLSDKPLATWYGVTTSDSGRVTTLRLSGNGLNGPVPDLSALTELTHLDLGYNWMTGPVHFLRAFTELTFLDLSINRLSGPVPDLDGLSELTHLDLRRNGLTGSIPDLGAFSKLELLNLEGNSFSGSIPDLSALTSLEKLYLGSNELSGPIPDLSALTSLTELFVSSNELSGSIPDLSALTGLVKLSLRFNELSGSIPDLSALAELQLLTLSGNELSGSIPDLSALTELRELFLSNNELSGSIPDLSVLTELRELFLDGNELSGSIPDLNALADLQLLFLNDNELSGPIPDMIALSSLRTMNLSSNQLSGPILDLNALTGLESVDIRFNQLSGPLPDWSALTNLRGLFLAGNRFCLLEGTRLSHANSDVDARLKRLNLPTCTEADLPAVPAEPRNLTATVGTGQVTLAWDDAAGADSYDLWAWDSIDRRWGPIGEAVTATTYTHSVLTDGRNYYYQVRARDAKGMRGPWSQRAQAIIVPQQFPPPPPDLGLDLFYQKYFKVRGVVIVAPSEVSDEKMVQAREIVSGMLSGNPDLAESFAPKYIRVAIYKRNAAGERVSQLPEIRGTVDDYRGQAFRTAQGWIAAAPEKDPSCYVFIHEFAHAIHLSLEELSDNQKFGARLYSRYSAANNAGLWRGAYASENINEYWAETVTFWFLGFIREPLEARDLKLEEYDPDIAKLIAEIFGEDAYVPAFCKVPFVQIEIDF